MAKLKNVRLLVALVLIALVTLLSVSVLSLGAAASGETTAAVETTVTAETTAAVTTAADTTADDTTEDTGLGLGFWISMGVLGVLIIVGVFFGIKYREGLVKWLRSYKSEIKKIVWMPWPDVRKNTIVVIVVIVVLGILIAMLDYVFSKGIIALGNLL